jgi:hypothetical protein
MKAMDMLNMKEIRELLDLIDRPIAFRRAMVDLTGSVQSALMLSQAIYWQERVIRKDGWWYKSIEEWQEETGLSRRRLETARKQNRKYLMSVLRDIPARLYWIVNREALITDLASMRLVRNPAWRQCSRSWTERGNQVWRKTHIREVGMDQLILRKPPVRQAVMYDPVWMDPKNRMGAFIQTLICIQRIQQRIWQ